jgi:hypothetical protein
MSHIQIWTSLPSAKCEESERHRLASSTAVAARGRAPSLSGDDNDIETRNRCWLAVDGRRMRRRSLMRPGPLTTTAATTAAITPATLATTAMTAHTTVVTITVSTAPHTATGDTTNSRPRCRRRVGASARDPDGLKVRSFGRGGVPHAGSGWGSRQQAIDPGPARPI